jgi:uncharacterized membrane protein YGL010W
MKSLAEQLAFYQSYHRTPGCKAMHFFGVPLVTFSILIPMGWLSVSAFGFRASLAMAFVACTLGYYFMLAPFLAMLMTLAMLPITWGADRVSQLPFKVSLAVFAITFISGWIFQLVGHAIEGRKPALLDNFGAIFTAPLFLLAETLPLLGIRRDKATQSPGDRSKPG